MPALPKNAQAFPAVSGTGAAASPPTLSVAGRVDGGAYTVSAGGRSITITAQAGATVETTAKRASDGATVSVTDPTTATPDWTAPSGGTTGEAVQVRVTATLGGLSTSVAFVERVAGSGGGASWVTKLSLDLTGATPSGPHQSGTTTIDATGGDVDMDVRRVSNNGNVSITAAGAVVTAVGSQGAVTGAFNLKDALSGFDLEYLRFYSIAVDVTVTAVNFDDDGSIFQVSLGDSDVFNDGDTRGLEVYRASATDETRRVRGANGTTVIGSQRAQVTQRVVTLVLTSGQIVTVADTDGGTAPANPHTASPLFTAGGDAVGRNDDTPLFLANFYLLVSAFGAAASITVSDIVVRRWE